MPAKLTSPDWLKLTVRFRKGDRCNVAFIAYLSQIENPDISTTEFWTAPTTGLRCIEIKGRPSLLKELGEIASKFGAFHVTVN